MKNNWWRIFSRDVQLPAESHIKDILIKTPYETNLHQKLCFDLVMRRKCFYSNGGHCKVMEYLLQQKGHHKQGKISAVIIVILAVSL